MEVLNFIFRIGVILAVYNFLWWLIMVGITILKGNKPNRLGEVYLLKAVRYGFLADVMFLFVLEQSGGFILMNQFILAGAIMLIYFLGRLQKKKDKQMFFSMTTQTNIPEINDFMNKIKPVFDYRFEILVIALAMSLFAMFYFFNTLAYNAVSNWFLESILNIEDTPVFGFVFKVVGFFFLLSVMIKIFMSISLLIFPKNNQNFNNHPENHPEDFDDYEEIK